jgi:hypothetical protein
MGVSKLGSKLAAKLAGGAGLALMLGTAAAGADGLGHLTGNISLGYDRQNASDQSANLWDASGQAVLTLSNPGANLQVNLNNTGIKFNGKDFDNWSIGGDAYWRDYAGDFGIDITQNTLVTNVTGHDYRSGGFFGEFFALSDLTLRAKGGKFQGDSEGWYGSTGLVFYPADQISVSLTGDYARFQHDGPRVTDGTFAIEYLPVREIPVSISIGYTFARYTHTAITTFANDNNIFSVTVKAYFGGGGRSGGLVDYDRNGAVNWDSAPSTILGTSF